MQDKVIPKIIHYCWFGGKEKPDNVKKCIQSWKDKLPGYQFIEWNEDNFEFAAIPYSKEAYAAKKYAFVSDVARIQGLLKFGGIYMDTDVEVLKDFEPLLEHECILGFEEKNFVATSLMGAVKEHPLFKEFADIYKGLRFIDEDGNINTETNVKKLTEMLKKQGLKCDNQMQVLRGGITVFPQEYFSPYDYINCYYKITENSFCVHHFFVSWMPWGTKLKKNIKKIAVKTIGPDRMNHFRERFMR